MSLDGIINPDSDFAKSIGFTSDLFDGYLWCIENIIIVSLIVSKKEGQGNFSRLIKEIEGRGFKVSVPTPSGRMRAILEKKGFQSTVENDEDFGAVEVMVRV